VEQRNENGRHQWRLSENARNLNPRNVYSVLGRHNCSDESLRDLAGLPIDGYIATRRFKHSERPAPAPRGRIPHHATALERMTRKLRTRAGAAIHATRKGIVEPVLGQIKQGRGFRQFLLRGLDKVRAEWALVCDAQRLEALSDLLRPTAVVRRPAP